MLEGFVLRLAQADCAEAFALRGGVLVRNWFPRKRAFAADIDFLCRLPYDTRGIRSIAKEIVSSPLRDGVLFDEECFRIDEIWRQSRHPGLRLFIAGEVDGWSHEINVDLTFRLTPWPAAERTPLVFPAGTGHVWTCPPEMVIGTKLRVIGELGVQQWRPKDLSDIWLMLRRFSGPEHQRRLPEAIARAFAVGLYPGELEAKSILETPSFWRERRSTLRWEKQTDLPLPAVVGEVRKILLPMVSGR